MASKIAVHGVAAACCAVVLAGCSQTQEGHPSPTPGQDSQQPAANQGNVSNGAPKVPNPQDVSRFKKDPCSILTASQLKTLEISAAGAAQDVGTNNAGCQWQSGPDQPSISIAFIPNPNGLSDLYKLNQQHRFQAWAVLPPINGFPAVKDIPVVAPGNTDCAYGVGLNDKDVADVQVTNVTSGDSCTAVLQVAKDVTLTVKGEN